MQMIINSQNRFHTICCVISSLAKHEYAITALTLSDGVSIIISIPIPQALTISAL